MHTLIMRKEESDQKTVLMVGTFDTKRDEFAFLREELVRHGLTVISLDAGIRESASVFPVDITAGETAKRGGKTLDLLRKAGDRGQAVTVMGRGARAIAEELFAAGEIAGVIGMGGGGGTSIATTAMSGLPIGVPKLCISTAASGDTSGYIRERDIVLFPSVVDICGINAFSRKIISNAAAAFSGMVGNTAREESGEDEEAVFLSMFGNTTAAGERCRALLQKARYTVVVFHAIGSGGRALEELVREGYAAGVLDLTTTELADEVCGGHLSAGPTRLDAPGEMNVPHLIVPGCLDMVNYMESETIPGRYLSGERTFFRWAPEASLMRTNAEENALLGRIFAEKANRAKTTTAFLIPQGGYSELSREGGKFEDREADWAFEGSLREHLDPEIRIETCRGNINDPEFADQAVRMMISLLNKN